MTTWASTRPTVSHGAHSDRLGANEDSVGPGGNPAAYRRTTVSSVRPWRGRSRGTRRPSRWRTGSCSPDCSGTCAGSSGTTRRTWRPTPGWKSRGTSGGSRGRAGFRGWTATIARHRALDHLRRQKVRPRATGLENDVLELPGTHSTHDQALESLSTEHALELVARLPRDQAEAVLLRVVVGLDGPAAARVLGKRPGAVRTAAHRGLKRLAQQLGADGEPGV